MRISPFCQQLIWKKLKFILVIPANSFCIHRIEYALDKCRRQQPDKHTYRPILRTHRRKRTAYLEMEMFGRTIRTKLGLGIVRKQ